MPRRGRRRPKISIEPRNDRYRAVWRFGGHKHHTSFTDDPEDARADASRQIDAQLAGTWRDPRGAHTLVEDWVNEWWPAQDLEPTTEGNYRYLIEFHILPAFGRCEIGSLTYEQINTWEKQIRSTTRSTGGTYAASTASAARSRLITILGDAVQAGLIPANPAQRRRTRGRKHITGRAQTRRPHQQILTPSLVIQAAERAALLTGRCHDFALICWAGWTGERWGELIATEQAFLSLPDIGTANYQLDWQLREIGGKVEKAPPKDGSYRGIDLPPFLVSIAKILIAERRPCGCPRLAGRPACKGNDDSPASYLFLGPGGGHPRRSNYADRVLTPAVEGSYPARNGKRLPVYVTTEPWPGRPVRSTRKTKAADAAEGTWQPLFGHVWPHLFRHSHATWLEQAGIPLVMRRDRTGHAVSGMDATYLHVTPQMRRDCITVLETLFWQAIDERLVISDHSPVPLLSQFMAQRRAQQAGHTAGGRTA